MDVMILSPLTETKAPRSGGAVDSPGLNQRADQRTSTGRLRGTGDFTLTVTWYSRMFNETDLNGERAAKRDCFTSFIGPPSLSLSRLWCGCSTSYAL